MSEESGVVRAIVVVREFDPKRDCLGVERVERGCEVGPRGKMSLFTDLMGDPIGRVRHSPAFLMLVRLCNRLIAYPNWSCFVCLLSCVSMCRRFFDFIFLSIYIYIKICMNIRLQRWRRR